MSEDDEWAPILRRVQDALDGVSTPPTSSMKMISAAAESPPKPRKNKKNNKN